MWKTPYTKRFETEIAEFSPNIVGILAGHLHRDWTQILSYDGKNSVPMSGTPSISPIFGNDPGFKIYTYSTTTKKIERSETHKELLREMP